MLHSYYTLTPVEIFIFLHHVTNKKLRHLSFVFFETWALKKPTVHAKKPKK